jgi:hypothetical protein
MDVPLHSKILAFYETLIKLLPPQSASDRTCFRRLGSWLQEQIDAGRLGEEALTEVLSYARESRSPGVRNPRAVFMSILRKEMGYDPKRQ